MSFTVRCATGSSSIEVPVSSRCNGTPVVGSDSLRQRSIGYGAPFQTNGCRISGDTLPRTKHAQQSRTSPLQVFPGRVACAASPNNAWHIGRQLRQPQQNLVPELPNSFFTLGSVSIPINSPPPQSAHQRETAYSQSSCQRDSRSPMKVARMQTSPVAKPAQSSQLEHIAVSSRSPAPISSSSVVHAPLEPSQHLQRTTPCREQSSQPQHIRFSPRLRTSVSPPPSANLAFEQSSSRNGRPAPSVERHVSSPPIANRELSLMDPYARQCFRVGASDQAQMHVATAQDQRVRGGPFTQSMSRSPNLGSLRARLSPQGLPSPNPMFRSLASPSPACTHHAGLQTVICKSARSSAVQSPIVEVGASAGEACNFMRRTREEVVSSCRDAPNDILITPRKATPRRASRDHTSRLQETQCSEMNGRHVPRTLTNGTQGTHAIVSTSQPEEPMEDRENAMPSTPTRVSRTPLGDTSIVNTSAEEQEEITLTTPAIASPPLGGEASLEVHEKNPPTTLRTPTLVCRTPLADVVEEVRLEPLDQNTDGDVHKDPLQANSVVVDRAGDIDEDACVDFDMEPSVDAQRPPPNFIVGDFVLARFEGDRWEEAEISQILADGTYLVHWSDGCPSNRFKTADELRHKHNTLFHLGVAPRMESRLSRPNVYSTKLRTSGAQHIWVRKRMAQVSESQSFQYMFRIVFLMSECTFFTSFMESFLMACFAEPHEERSRVLVPCAGAIASLALQQLCPIVALSELQKKAQQSLKEDRADGTVVRPTSMRARSFSILASGLPELTDNASAESTMLVYMLHANAEKDLIHTHFETMRLVEDMYRSHLVSDFSPQRLLLVVEESGRESDVDVASMLQQSGLTDLEALSISWSGSNGESLRVVAQHIAEMLVERSECQADGEDYLPRQDSPKDQKAPFTIRICGVTGRNSTLVNGDYNLHISCYNEKPCWQKREAADLWLLWSPTGWNVTDTESKVARDGLCWLRSGDVCPLPTIANAWEVADEDIWMQQPVTVEGMEQLAESKPRGRLGSALGGASLML